jgi:hypothetical protein
MVDYRTWARLLRQIMNEFRHIVQGELDRFRCALENWVNELVMAPMPADWRKRTAALLVHWEREGFQLSPRSVETLEWWIEAWAAKRGFLPKDGADERGAPSPRDRAATTVQTIRPLKMATDGDEKAKPDTWFETHRGDRVWASGASSAEEMIDALYLVAVLLAKEQRSEEIRAALQNYRRSLLNQALGFLHFLVLDTEYDDRQFEELRHEQ